MSSPIISGSPSPMARAPLILMLVLAALLAGCATVQTEDREIKLIRKYEACVRNSSAQPGNAAHDPFRCDPIRDQIEALKHRRAPLSHQHPAVVARPPANPERQTAHRHLSHELAQAAHADQTGHHAQAEQLYSRILATHPGNIKARIGRGNARAAQGRLNEAKADYDRAIAEDPHSAAALNNRAIIEHAEGNDAAARRDLDRAIALNPSAAALRANRGRLAPAPSPAARRAESAAVGRGVALLKQHRLTEAIAAFNEALARDPGNAAALRDRGTAKALNGDLDGALADLSASLARDPGNVDALINRAAVYAQKGERNQAIADLDKALIREPQNKRIADELDRLRAGQ